jgi:hypothetical protein
MTVEPTDLYYHSKYHDMSSSFRMTYQISEAVVAPDCSMISGATKNRSKSNLQYEHSHTYSSRGCLRQQHH